MRVTIIRDDNTVTVDSLAFSVDCSTLPADVHAVQWDGTYGHVEYRTVRCEHCGARARKGNEAFTDFSPYKPYVDAWDVAKRAALEKAALAVAEHAKAAEDVAGPQS